MVAIILSNVKKCLFSFGSFQNMFNSFRIQEGMRSTEAFDGACDNQEFVVDAFSCTLFGCVS